MDRSSIIRRLDVQGAARFEDRRSVAYHLDELGMHPDNIRRALERGYIELEKPPRRRFSGNK